MGHLIAILLELVAALAAAPWIVGYWRLRPALPGRTAPLSLGSVLLCALAFNLTFIWQEIWLVIPKALTPGLHPVLYHNNHDWTGAAPNVELLQGAGALATLASGLVCLVAGWRWRTGHAVGLLLFWLAFQGLFQSLTQLAFGAMLPGNDVGRALTYLQVSAAGKAVLLVAAAVGMALAGVALARVYPSAGPGRLPALTRAFAAEMFLTALACVAVSAPFRVPRDLVEVAVVPLFINLFGAGWVTLGAAFARRSGEAAPTPRVEWRWAAALLVLLLLAFQLGLRRGLAFG